MLYTVYLLSAKINEYSLLTHSEFIPNLVTNSVLHSKLLKNIPNNQRFCVVYLLTLPLSLICPSLKTLMDPIFRSEILLVCHLRRTAEFFRYCLLSSANCCISNGETGSRSSIHLHILTVTH